MNFHMHSSDSQSVIMDEFTKAADGSSTMSIRDRVAVLYDAALILSEMSLSWCHSGDSKLTQQLTDQLPTVSVSAGSEEYRQILRVHLRVDDISRQIWLERTFVQTDLDLSGLIQLIWSLAIVGSYDDELVRQIQSRILSLLASSEMTAPESIQLMFAEATFFTRNATMELDFDDSVLKELSVDALVNALFSFSLMERSKAAVSKLRRVLVGTLLSDAKSLARSRVVSFAARAVLFSSMVTGEDAVHDLGKIKSAFPDLSKGIDRPAWKYSFQLCLACHGVASKGVEINPLIEGELPFDCMFTPPSSSSRKRNILLELVRRSSLVRELATDAVTNVDGYTRMTRMLLAGKGYRIVAITVNEWASLGGDVDRQMRFVKRRIRSALRQKRMYSGMERDESVAQGEESDEVSSEAESDMSY